MAGQKCEKQTKNVKYSIFRELMVLQVQEDEGEGWG